MPQLRERPSERRSRWEAILAHYDTIWSVDFEFIAKPGDIYDVVCLTAVELISGRVIRLWRDEMGRVPPYDIGPRSLFLAYAAQAELGCHLALRWGLPANVICTRVEYRRITNGNPRALGHGSLLDALEFYRLPGVSAVKKDAARSRIMQGWPFMPEVRTSILDYCLSDSEEDGALWSSMLPDINLPQALRRGRFVAACAIMEFLGISMDWIATPKLLDPESWDRVRGDAIPRLDRFNIYRDGHWKDENFEAQLARDLITSWPRLDSGKLDLKRRTFRSMVQVHQQYAPYYELRHHLSQMRKLKLSVGKDGRCRTVWWPFSSKTGRSQPKATQQPFGHSTWVRSLMRPERGWAMAYVDINGAEFGIAGARSGDLGMIQQYNSQDPYLGCAKLFGMAPADATKQTHGTIRDIFKVGLLSIQYWIKTRSLAQRLNLLDDTARYMIEEHHAHFPQYWHWSKSWVAHAFTTGMMRSQSGWTMSLEKPIRTRTVVNWPIQVAGAELFQLACVMATRIGVRIVAPVHDAVLIEAREEDIERDVARMRLCFERASTIVLKRLTLRTDHVIIRYPDRYVDKRGIATWQAVEGTLADLDRAHLATIPTPVAEGARL